MRRPDFLLPGWMVAAAALLAFTAVLSPSSSALAGPETAAVEADPAPASSPLETPPLLDAIGRHKGPWSRADIVATIEKEAKRAGLPAEIAEAVAHTESGLNPSRIGADGEIGLMQVLPSTARMMGFSGSLADLTVPDTNIRYGVTYLARAYRLAGGDLCTATMKYRAGHGETRFSYLSVDYCRKVRARLSTRGFAVTGIVPTPTFGSAVRVALGAGCRGGCLRGYVSNANIAALNSKLSQIVFRVSVVTLPRP